MADLGMQQGQFGLNQPQVDVPGLGGYAQGMALNQAQRNWELQNLFNQQVQAANQAKMQEWGLNAPVRGVEREAALETTLPTARTKLGMEEEALTQRRIETPVKASEATTKISGQQLLRQEQDLEKFNLALPSFQGPTASKDFADWADESGWKKGHPWRKYLEGATGSDDFQMRAGRVMNHAATSLEQRRKLHQLNLQTGSAERIADIQAESAKDRAAAQERMVRDKADREKKLEERWTAVYQELQNARRSGNKDVVEMLTKEFNEIGQMLFQLKAAGAPSLGPQIAPGGGGIQYPQREFQAIPGGTPPTSGPKAGDVLQGYKFKGGNPADKNNWTKVQ
jgi:hypothetical protein